MVSANQITLGMILSLEGGHYCVETLSKVTKEGERAAVQVKLRDIANDQTSDRTFQASDTVRDVVPSERVLEFLYPQDRDYLFLDINTLEEVTIVSSVIGARIEYMQAGVQVRASAYSDAIFAIELPQFLELMVANVEDQFVESTISGSVPSKKATLETGATLKVPSFVEVGDVIKVDTRAEEYIQRI